MTSDDRDLWDDLEDLQHEIAALDKQAVKVRRVADKIRVALGPRPVPPWEEDEVQVELKVPAAPRAKRAKRDPRDKADKFADELSDLYPHGWSAAGHKRPPGLKQAAAALRKHRTRGYDWEVIRLGVIAYGEAVKGTDDQQFSPALFRWIRDERWRELPEQMTTKRAPLTEEEKASRAAAAVKRDRERLAEQARRAGVQLDPETGKVVDWGPKGAPKHARGSK